MMCTGIIVSQIAIVAICTSAYKMAFNFYRKECLELYSENSVIFHSSLVGIITFLVFKFNIVVCIYFN